MTTLTEVAYYTRRSVVYGAIGIVSLIILRILWGAFIQWWVKNHPPPPPPPSIGFGVLSEQIFPKDRDRTGFTYTLETVTGEPPNLGSQAKVFFMPAFRANVLGLELATNVAAKLGFLFAPVPKDEHVYQWVREGALPGTLTVQLVTGHFTLETAWQKDAEITTARAPSEQEAIKAAKDYLRRANLLPQDLESGKTRVEFLRAGTDSFTSALSQSDANFVRVHIFRSSVNELQVVTSRSDQALVQVVVSAAPTAKQIVAVDYKYSPVELERAETYPLRSTLVAWQQIQAEQGVIVSLTKDVTAITIRSIELAYFDSEVPQEFLQPVYVFRGDNNFIGYISAIEPKWLGKRSN